MRICELRYQGLSPPQVITAAIGRGERLKEDLVHTHGSCTRGTKLLWKFTDVSSTDLDDDNLH